MDSAALCHRNRQKRFTSIARGVFHRDLKPGNVMLTKSGTVADFGLAKLGSESNPIPAGLTAATEVESNRQRDDSRHPAHGAGATEGKDTDARSDIFAFGAVLYEMATGHKAFEGKSAPSVM
jgi:serine/threonine protein kinase